MRQRLPIAFSTAALVVALLGATSLGEAARNGVATSVENAKRASGLAATKSTARRGPRGPRGRRGPRGLRGPRGFQGPPGDKGDKGDPHSEAFSARNSAGVAVTGIDSATGTAVASLASLPGGNYVISAQVAARGTGAGRLACEVRAGAAVGSGRSQIGESSGGTLAATLSIVFGAPIPNGGPAQLRCWEEQGSTTDPIVTADLVAVRVGTLTQTGS
jgi:hypothetical protein